MTNMDITTGHMVLAYMEDHLNNKARLDTEWAALCTYDADPCSVAIAQLVRNFRIFLTATGRYSAIYLPTNLIF